MSFLSRSTQESGFQTKNKTKDPKEQPERKSEVKSGELQSESGKNIPEKYSFHVCFYRFLLEISTSCFFLLLFSFFCFLLFLQGRQTSWRRRLYLCVNLNGVPGVKGIILRRRKTFLNSVYYSDSMNSPVTFCVAGEISSALQGVEQKNKKFSRIF